MIEQNEQLDQTVRNYQDTSGLSTGQLDFGLWYVKNRKNFFLALIVILILTAAITIGYALYNFSAYLLVGQKQDQQTFIDLSSSASLVTSKVNVGSNVSYSDVKVLSSQNNNSDLVAAVTNNNPYLLINVTYYFIDNGQKLGAATDFVLPEDTKYLVALNQPLPSNTPAQLVVESLAFVRLDRHTITDWDRYRQERFNFLIENATFTNSADSGLSDRVDLGQLDFKITNNSAYGYKEVPLIIILKSQGEIVAVNRYSIDNFLSQTEKDIQLRWPGRLPTIDKIEIVPNVNITNDSVFLKYSS